MLHRLRTTACSLVICAVAALLLLPSCKEDSPSSPEEAREPAWLQVTIDYQGSLGPVGAARPLSYGVFAGSDFPYPPVHFGRMLANGSTDVVSLMSGGYYLAAYLDADTADAAASHDFIPRPGDPYVIYDQATLPPGDVVQVPPGDTASVTITFGDLYVYEPPDPANHLPAFDRDSFFPVVEGAWWSYDFGKTVRVAAVDSITGNYRIENVGIGGWLDGSSGVDGSGPYAATEESQDSFFLPIHDYFGFRPTMYADHLIVPGFAWGNDGYSGDAEHGYFLIQNRLRVVSLGASFTTREGHTYHDCAVLEWQITYPNGYHWDTWLTSVTYYLKRGAGYVAEIRTWSDSSTETHYVTSYSIP